MRALADGRLSEIYDPSTVGFQVHRPQRPLTSKCRGNVKPRGYSNSDARELKHRAVRLASATESATYECHKTWCQTRAREHFPAAASLIVALTGSGLAVLRRLDDAVPLTVSKASTWHGRRRRPRYTNARSSNFGVGTYIT